MAYRNNRSYSNSWGGRGRPNPGPPEMFAEDDDIEEVYNSSTDRCAQPQHQRFSSSGIGRGRDNGPNLNRTGFIENEQPRWRSNLPRARQPPPLSSSLSNPINPLSLQRQLQPGAFQQQTSKPPMPLIQPLLDLPNSKTMVLPTPTNSLETNLTFSFKDFDAIALQILASYGFNNVLSVRTLQAWYLRFVKHVREHNNRLNICVSQLERDHSLTSVCIQLQEGMQHTQRAQPYFGDDCLSVVFEEYNNAFKAKSNTGLRYGQNTNPGQTPESKLRNIATTLQQVLNDPSNGTLSVTGQINSFTQEEGEDRNEENAYRDKWNPINCDLPFPVFVQHVNWKLATSPKKKPLPHFDIGIFKLRYVEHMSQVENNDKAFLLATTTAYGHDMTHYPLRAMELLKRTGIFRETSREFNTDFGVNKKTFIAIHNEGGNVTGPRQSKLPSNQNHSANFSTSTPPKNIVELNANIPAMAPRMLNPEPVMQSHPHVASSRPFLPVPTNINQNQGFGSMGSNIRPPIPIAFGGPDQKGSILNDPTKVLRNPIRPDESFKKKMTSVRAELSKSTNLHRAANNNFGSGRPQTNSMATPVWSPIPSLKFGQGILPLPVPVPMPVTGGQGILPLPRPVPSQQNRIGPLIPPAPSAVHDGYNDDNTQHNKNIGFSNNSRPLENALQRFKFQLPGPSFSEETTTFNQAFEGYSTVRPSISPNLHQKFPEQIPDRGYNHNPQHEREMYNRDPSSLNNDQYDNPKDMREHEDPPIKLPYEITFDIWKLVCEKSRRFIHNHPSGAPLRALTEDEYRIWYARYLYHVEENYDKFLQGIKSGYPPADYPQEVRDMITHRQLTEEGKCGTDWGEVDEEEEEQQPGLTLDWQTRDQGYDLEEEEDLPGNSTQYEYGHNSEHGHEIFQGKRPYVDERNNYAALNPEFPEPRHNQDRDRPGFSFKRPRFY